MSDTIDVHKISGKAVEHLLRKSMQMESTDNLTVILLAFKGFEVALEGMVG